MNEIAEAFIASCRDEIEAPKPGNVHIFAAGHGMAAEHFLHSAEVAATPLCESASSVGERILSAVEATWASVGMNTNLGIILLCAPLAAAADLGGDLHAAVKTVLAGLTRDDAQLAFRAILRASPAGLGKSGRHDVHDAAETTLLEAMREAAGRDRIAYQYAADFSDIFETGTRLSKRLAKSAGRRPGRLFPFILGSSPAFPIATSPVKMAWRRLQRFRRKLSQRATIYDQIKPADSLDDSPGFRPASKGRGIESRRHRRSHRRNALCQSANWRLDPAAQ